MSFDELSYDLSVVIFENKDELRRIMNKLNVKISVGFAIIWILTYVVGSSLADYISDTVGYPKLFTAVFHVLFVVAIIIYLIKNSLTTQLGLCLPKASPAKFLYYVPLLVIMSCNLWTGLDVNEGVGYSVFYVISMLCVGFAEEMIFRGFLFRAMAENNVKSAVIVSALTFGIGHLINLFNGSGMNPISNLCQVVYAVAFGFLCITIYYRSGSLLPCIIAHSTVNAMSVFACQPKTVWVDIVTGAILAVLSILYCLILNRTLTDNKKQEEE